MEKWLVGCARGPCYQRRRSAEAGPGYAVPAGCRGKWSLLSPRVRRRRPRLKPPGRRRPMRSSHRVSRHRRPVQPRRAAARRTLIGSRYPGRHRFTSRRRAVSTEPFRLAPRPEFWGARVNGRGYSSRVGCGRPIFRLLRTGPCPGSPRPKSGVIHPNTLGEPWIGGWN
jgi:hypothetical protein